MGNLGLQYDYNYHLERIEDVKTVDLDVFAQIVCTDVDFAGSVASIDASVSLKKKAKQEIYEVLWGSLGLKDMPVLMLILVVVKFKSMLCLHLSKRSKIRNERSFSD